MATMIAVVNDVLVMVTASVQGHHRAQAEQATVDAFIAKPFDPDELVAIVGVLAASGRLL